MFFVSLIHLAQPWVGVSCWFLRRFHFLTWCSSQCVLGGLERCSWRVSGIVVFWWFVPGDLADALVVKFYYVYAWLCYFWQWLWPLLWRCCEYSPFFLCSRSLPKVGWVATIVCLIDLWLTSMYNSSRFLLSFWRLILLDCHNSAADAHIAFFLKHILYHRVISAYMVRHWSGCQLSVLWSMVFYAWVRLLCRRVWWWWSAYPISRILERGKDIWGGYKVIYWSNS